MKKLVWVIALVFTACGSERTPVQATETEGSPDAKPPTPSPAQRPSVETSIAEDAAIERQLDGRWVTLAQMHEPREFASATVLRDGRVLVVGGEDDAHALASAELFDPATGQWTQSGQLSLPRTRHAAILLEDGRVLVVGGASSAKQEPIGPLLFFSEMYDPTTGMWARLADVPYAGSGDLFLRSDGRVLWVGQSGAVLGYDPRIDAWEVYDPPICTHHLAHAAYTEGGVVVFGGYCSLMEFWRGETGTWETLGSVNVRRPNWPAVATLNPRTIIAVHGDPADQPPTSELWNADTNTWRLMPQPRYWRGASVPVIMGPGLVMLVGGADTLSDATAEVFDLSRNSWALVPQMGSPHGYRHFAVRLHDGRVLVGGGFNTRERRASKEVEVLELRPLD